MKLDGLVASTLPFRTRAAVVECPTANLCLGAALLTLNRQSKMATRLGLHASQPQLEGRDAACILLLMLLARPSGCIQQRSILASDSRTMQRGRPTSRPRCRPEHARYDATNCTHPLLTPSRCRTLSHATHSYNRYSTASPVYSPQPYLSTLQLHTCTAAYHPLFTSNSPLALLLHSHYSCCDATTHHSCTTHSLTTTHAPYTIVEHGFPSTNILVRSLSDPSTHSCTAR